jgi:hypothetical protein
MLLDIIFAFKFYSVVAIILAVLIFLFRKGPERLSTAIVFALIITFILFLLGWLGFLRE